MNSFTEILDQLIASGVSLGKSILTAAIIYFIGRYVIKGVNKLVARMMAKRDLDPSVRSFLGSAVNIVLVIFLVIAIIGALGIETTSFAALLASAGVAIGMALSGNLQNFAGGLLILLLKPFKVGDYVEAQGLSGTVKEIQIFHTILTTPDNKVNYIPNGALSNGVLTNYSNQVTRRVEWIISIEYGEDYEKAKAVIETILANEPRILEEPDTLIALGALADSSVNITVRAWVNSSDYWSVYFDMNKTIYATFNKEGIGFPFPQLTVHQA
ncbi:MAG: mechanosensitive ion channel [Paludibacteraceae bacterium]|nr:mechanosensitive ion channel [Paludibacteraceae bacterium]